MRDVCDLIIMTNCHLMKNSCKKMGQSLFIIETSTTDDIDSRFNNNFIDIGRPDTSLMMNVKS